MSSFGLNVFDFGAKGDGITDDTAAIQAAIDFAAKRGGGKILFPYTNKGYRIASPGVEMVDGKPVRAQLVIPAGNSNIQLEGEMPCRMLNPYQIRPVEMEKEKMGSTQFGSMPVDNTLIFSDWDAPEEHDPKARPWSIISAPEGNLFAGNFSLHMFSIKNLEFRVPMRLDKMYPTQSCANLQNIARVNVSDCQFCLNEQVGDAITWKELLPNPCHTAGLITSADQNDNNIIRNVAVQGFRYGFVFGEHVTAEHLYVHNCEEGITYHDCSHLSMLNHVVAQHNRIILSTTTTELFGMHKGPCKVIIGAINFECGSGLHPVVSQLKYGIYDPENRLYGSVVWHKPWGKQEFPVFGAENFTIKKFEDDIV